MAFSVDQRVKIKEIAFGDSQDPKDVALRGKVVTLTFDLGEQFRKDWAGCWEAITDEGETVQLIEEEIEVVRIAQMS